MLAFDEILSQHEHDSADVPLNDSTIIKPVGASDGMSAIILRRHGSILTPRKISTIPAISRKNITRSQARVVGQGVWKQCKLVIPASKPVQYTQT